MIRVVDGVFISIGAASTAGSLVLVATGVGMPIPLCFQSVGIGASILTIIGKFFKKRPTAKAT